MRYQKSLLWTGFVTLTSLLSACGGGNGSTSPATGSVAPTNTSTVASASVSSGTISAFGSVFVNGHEFSTVGATVVDDDSGAISNTTNGLEVGQVVDVIPASDSTDANPVARELHIHPLARGYVDVSDTTAATVTVMGQTVQVTAATVFSDHRACVTDPSNPCIAIADQSGLTATTGTGTAAVAGNYVYVHGYLFNGESAASMPTIVASLISVGDVPPSTQDMVAFKAEGVVTAIDNKTITIGSLDVDLSAAKCIARGMQNDCATAFKTGEVVSTYAAAAPSLPATTFTADGARLSAKIPANVADLTVEIDGVVFSVTASPAGFVVRGITIDATGLPAATALPTAGDIVRLEGTVGNDGTSIVATSVTVLRAAASSYYEFVGDETSVAASADANTYTLTLLGQSITVNASTWLADHSRTTWSKLDPTGNPFNIHTFQSYLANSASQHLAVRAMANAGGKLTALTVTIVPASTVSSAAGKVDATPAPVNSTTTGTPSRFAIHGVTISADPKAVIQPAGAQTSVAGGDKVIAVGNYTAGSLTITTPANGSNEVVVFGKPAVTAMPVPIPVPVTTGGSHGMM